jgi:CubicO group peptidase (beta-lactamase class C family)
VDYGCGTGLLSMALQSAAGRVVGVDTSAGMLAKLQEKIQATGVTNVEARALDLSTEGPPDDLYPDLIVSAMTLHHIADLPSLLRAFRQWLRPGGYLALADLDTEDGSFHGSNADVHHLGIDRRWLVAELAGLGLQEVRATTASVIERPNDAGEVRRYPIFLVSAQKAGTAFPGADWEEASPGVDAADLKAAVTSLDERLRDYGGAGALAIVRHGHLLWAGPDSDVRYQIHSATKSLTSTCLGLLIEDGKATLDARAADVVSALREHYPDVTLRHFATMTSGYDAAGGTYEQDAAGRLDGGNTPLTPAPPLFPPGAKFRYWDKAMLQFGNVLTRLAGEPLDALFRRRIADAIGMTGWEWYSYPTPDGPILHCTGGFVTSARELARFGHLFLNRGNWNGRQLVTASWVDQATAVQVPATLPNDDLPRSRGAGIYGYNWWVNGLKPNGQRLWPEAPAGTYYANGLHANVCIVVPEWDMVIARTNGGRPDRGANTPPDIDAIWSAFLGQVGAAL